MRLRAVTEAGTARDHGDVDDDSDVVDDACDWMRSISWLGRCIAGCTGHMDLCGKLASLTVIFGDAASSASSISLSRSIGTTAKKLLLRMLKTTRNNDGDEDRKDTAQRQ